MTTELEEVLYKSFKHDFEAFLSHGLNYNELVDRMNFDFELMEKFVDRYYDEEFKFDLLSRLKRIANAFFERKEV